MQSGLMPGSTTAKLFINTFQREGIWGFYRGIASPILGIGACNAVLFASYTTAANHFNWSPWHSGAFAGAAMAFINCPVESLKVLVQTNNCYTGIFDAARKVPARLWIFRALPMTICRDIPSFAAYFGVWSLLREQLDWHPVLAGGLAGMSAWVPAYPQDLLKSCQQTGCSSTNTNVIHLIRTIHARHGFRGFWRGFGVCLARAFPANAATFWAYDTISRALDANRASTSKNNNNKAIEYV